MIPYGRQDISEADIQAVVEILKSDFLTQGPAVPAFEKAVSEYCNANYAFAVNSATSALHIACLALGVSKGDLVWTSPITFVASANCALYCGADVDFVDIDAVTYNMSVNVLEEKLIKAEKEGRLPKVVIPVHLAGQSCEMDKIYELSKKFGFKIIEDASHAIGGKYKNHAIGGCHYSDITVFSFHPVKIITTGEGGMCLTNDSDLAISLNRFRSHGIVRQPSEMTHVSDGPWYYQQVELGYNYRMTDIQAALGISQMKRIDEFVKARHAIFERYNEFLKEDWLELPWQHNDTYSALHLYIIRIKNNNKGITHRQLFEKLRNAGVLVNLHYIPIYRHPYYELKGYDNKAFPNAEAYYSQAISLPIFSSLTESEQQFVIDTIKKTFRPSEFILMNKAITKLESQRLLLIPINNSFCSVSYLSWLNDPEICKYLESGGAYNMVTLNEYIHNAVINNVFFWAICLKSNNKHIGNIKIDPISLRHQRGEYGILIGDKTEWGKGYAKEASDLIIEFCFKKLNLRKITLGVVESNMAAVSLYKKMCFQIEGVYKDHGIYENKVENVLRMAIFNPGFIYE